MGKQEAENGKQERSFSIKEAADFIGISVGTLRKDMKIPDKVVYYRFGDGTIRFYLNDLLEYKEKCRVKN